MLKSRMLIQKRFARTSSGALILCAGFAIASLALSSAVSAQDPHSTPPNTSQSSVWYPPEQPYVPGPQWFADDPPLGSDPSSFDLSTQSARRWNNAYPFKYYPQGGISNEVGDDDWTFVPAGEPSTCYCTPPPCYFGTFFLNVMVLERDSVQAQNVIFDAAGAPLAGTASLNLETEAGLHGGIVLASPYGHDWIFEYLGVHDFQSTATFTGTNMGFVFFGAPSAAFTASEYTLQYESNLDSGEFTIRSRQSPHIAMLAGFRYVGLHEDFNILNTVSPLSAAVVSETTNDLFGFQFGMQAMLWERNRWQFETIGKVGAYYNDLDVNASDGTTTFSASSAGVAFVGDLRAGITYRLGPLLVFRMGYQGLWLEGVASGPEQSAAMSALYNRTNFDLSRVVYQGGYMGFQLTW